jgi:hypothetical protein
MAGGQTAGPVRTGHGWGSDRGTGPREPRLGTDPVVAREDMPPGVLAATPNVEKFPICGRYVMVTLE